MPKKPTTFRRFVSKTKASEKYAQAYKRRRNPTPAERCLWLQLKARGCVGMKFRRESPILGWFVDFYCPAHKLVVEVDGGCHDTPEQASRDAYRDRAMQTVGVTVLRFTNDQVLTDIASVLARIAVYAQRRAA